MFEGLERFERFASWFRRESASNSTGKTATYRFVQQPPGALGHGWVGESNPAVLRSYRPPAFQTRTTTGTSFSVAIPKENANSYLNRVFFFCLRGGVELIIDATFEQFPMFRLIVPNEIW